MVKYDIHYNLNTLAKKGDSLPYYPVLYSVFRWLTHILSTSSSQPSAFTVQCVAG